MADIENLKSEQPVIAELDASPYSPVKAPGSDSSKEVVTEEVSKPKEAKDIDNKRVISEKQVALDSKPLPQSSDDIKAAVGPEFSEKRTLTKSDIEALKVQTESQSAGQPGTPTGTLPRYTLSDGPPMSTTTTSPSQLLPGQSVSSRSYREFGFYHIAPWRPTHNTIVDPDNCAKYFVEVSEFSKGKPDVTLRDVKSSNPTFATKGENLSADEGKQCLVVAFAQYAHGSKDKVRVGLGDYEKMGNVKWAEMTKLNDEEWQVNVEVEGSSKKFEWRGARSSSFSSTDVGGEASTPSSEALPLDSSSGQMPAIGTFKFVDSTTRTTLALYTEAKLAKGWKKRGKMRFYDRRAEQEEELSTEDLELLSMMCACVTNEKRRRKTWRKWGSLGMSSSK